MQKTDTAQALKIRLKTVSDTVQQEFANLTDVQLTQKPADGGWSISECLQHLTIFGRPYVKNIQYKLDIVKMKAQPSDDQILESGLIGRIAQNSLNPGNAKKLPTTSMFRPDAAINPQQTMAQFLDVHNRLFNLIDHTTRLDWNREKIATPYGNWLKLRLGDVLIMLVSHTERHLNQAMRVKVDLFP